MGGSEEDAEDEHLTVQEAMELARLLREAVEPIDLDKLLDRARSTVIGSTSEDS